MSSDLHLHFVPTVAILACSRGWGSPLLLPPPLPPLPWVCLWRPRLLLAILLESSSLHNGVQPIHRLCPPLSWRAACSAALANALVTGQLLDHRPPHASSCSKSTMGSRNLNLEDWRKIAAGLASVVSAGASER